MPGRLVSLTLLLLAAAGPISNGVARAGDGLTGITDVDRVIRATLARDAATLVELVGYTEASCSPDGVGLGAPPGCSTLGVPPETVVRLLPVSISETEFMPERTVPAFIQNRLQQTRLAFYGVLRPAALPSAAFLEPVAEYAVVFQITASPGEAFAFHLLGGRIVVIQGFGIGAHNLPAPDDPAWIVPPRP